MEILRQLAAVLPSTGLFDGILVDDPFMRALQYVLGIAAVVHVFVVFLVTRDILARTRSMLYQVICILLVAALPLAGIFLYLLIRPANTLSEKNIERALAEILENISAPAFEDGASDVRRCKKAVRGRKNSVPVAV